MTYNRNLRVYFSAYMVMQSLPYSTFSGTLPTLIKIIFDRHVRVSKVVADHNDLIIHTVNAYRQTTDKLMFKSVISTVR